VPAVVGHERFFIDYLHKDFSALGLSVHKQRGVLEVHGKQREQAVLCAHIDRHGLISVGGGEFVYAAQYIREVKYGENNTSSQKQLIDIAQRFEGEEVFAYDPVSGARLATGAIDVCYPDMRNHDALFLLRDMPPLEQNIPVAYARSARHGDGQLSGQIDNAISLAVVYQLFKDGFEGTALLSTEEEIGKSWIHLAHCLDGNEMMCENLLVLDTSPYTEQRVLDTGYVVLRHRDKSEIFNTALVDLLAARGAMLGMPVQLKDEYLQAQGKTVAQLGSTELGKLVQQTNGFWNGATIQVPTFMYHTSNETTTDEAINNFYGFLSNILIEDYLPVLRSGSYQTA